MSRSSPLAVVIPVLETMLHVAGQRQGAGASDDTRESLRARMRRLQDRMKQWRAEHSEFEARSSLLADTRRSASPVVESWFPLAIAARPAQPDNVFTLRPQPAKLQALFGDFTGTSLTLMDHGAGRLGRMPARAPFFDKVVEALDIALRIGQYGLTAVYTAVMDLWFHRHDVPGAAAGQAQQPRQRRAIECLCLAMMRFVVGFFGSRKVDARNNP